MEIERSVVIPAEVAQPKLGTSKFAGVGGRDPSAGG